MTTLAARRRPGIRLRRRQFRRLLPSRDRTLQRSQESALAQKTLAKMLCHMPRSHVGAVHRLLVTIQDKDLMEMLAQKRDIGKIIIKGLIFEEAGHRIRQIQSILQARSECLFRHPKLVFKKHTLGDYAESLWKEALALDTILNIIRTASLGSIAKEKTGLSQTLAEIAETLSKAFPDNKIILEDNAAKTRVNVNKTRLGFALFNLALNSKEHGASRITITVDHLKASQVQILIRDNGEGFASDLKDKITEPGFSTKGQEDRGVGTLIAKNIIEEHGGTFDIDSSGKGKGCTVTITLPTISA